jgi:hypothetical protein
MRMIVEAFKDTLELGLEKPKQVVVRPSRLRGIMCRGPCWGPKSGAPTPLLEMAPIRGVAVCGSRQRHSNPPHCT